MRRFLSSACLLLAATTVAGCTGSGSDSERPGTATRIASSGAAVSQSTSVAYITTSACPLPHASPSTSPPAALEYMPPPPVPYVQDWYGNDAVWVMLPTSGHLPSQRDDGALSTKFPFFRLRHGQVQVSAKRLDGPTGAFSAHPGMISAYGDVGFVPTGLSWSAPGCWQLRATVAGSDPLIFTVLVDAPTG